MQVLFGHSGEPRYLDFEKTKSLLITGAHSVGKSTLFHFLLQNLFTKANSRNLKITLFDANRVEFNLYSSVDCVADTISHKSDFEDFIRNFDASRYDSEALHFFVIDDLDYFDFKDYPYELCRSFFDFLKAVNASNHLRIILGCSFIYDSRSYVELGTYFNSKFLFLFPDFEELRIAGGIETAPVLGKNEFVAFTNNECYYPVTFKDIDDKEIVTATTKFSIRKFKEYELQRLKEAQANS